MKLIRIILLMSLISMFFSCEETEEGANDLIGTWIVTGSLYEYYMDNELDESYEENYNASFDNYYSAMIVEFSEEQVIFYENYRSAEYGSESENYSLENDMLFIIDEWDDTLAYVIELNGSELILTYTWEDAEYGEKEIEKYFFELYEGEFPPSGWESALEDDQFENDDSMDEARTVDVGLNAEKHTITADDSDWFKFSADSGKTYLVKVESYMDNELFITDQNHFNLADDDDNDNDLPVEDVESVVVWDCEKSAEYFIIVTAYGWEFYDDMYDGSHDLGYYAISLSETDIEAPFYKLSKNSPSKKRFGRLF